MDEKILTHIDLFSGIGGFTLAAEWAGFKTIAFCEKEKFCQKVLKKHWPEIPIIPEIRDFDGTKWRGATLLTGGFPCQPFSVAGQQRGKEDDRYLWPQMVRVIGEAKPRWILAENVPGIFRMALDTVLADLEGKGYSTGTFIIPASGVNAPHRRNRVWIVAHYGVSQSVELSGSKQKRRNGIGNSHQNALNSTGEREKSIPQQGSGNGVESSNSHAPDADRFNGNDGGFSPGKIPQQEKTKIQRRDNSYASNPAGGRQLKYLSEREKKKNACKGNRRNLWQENWHEVATRFCRVDDGVSDRIHRLKALGNAIVPQVAYEILKNIAWIEKNK